MSDVFTDNPEPQDLVSTLVGEDKKFKSLEDLAKGKIESDNYIEKLKAELEAANNKAAEATKLQELIEKMDQMNSSPAGGQSEEEPVTNAVEPTSLSAEDLKKLVSETLTETQKAELAKANREKASAALVEKFGDKAPEELKRIANTMGVSVDFLTSTAEQSPDAFMKLTGLSDSRQTGGFAQSQVRIEPNTNSQVRDWKYYTDLRKSNPALYYDAKTQSQMVKDVEEIGNDRFYGR